MKLKKHQISFEVWWFLQTDYIIHIIEEDPDLTFWIQKNTIH